MGGQGRQVFSEYNVCTSPSILMFNVSKHHHPSRSLYFAGKWSETTANRPDLSCLVSLKKKWTEEVSFLANMSLAYI
jgi:hypothetical protein